MGMGYAALIVYGILLVIGLIMARVVFVADDRAKNEKKGVRVKWQERN